MLFCGLPNVLHGIFLIYEQKKAFSWYETIDLDDFLAVCGAGELMTVNYRVQL